MPAGYVCIIHGARRPYRLRPNRLWMNWMGEYLLNHGVVGVSSFSWSGGFLRGLLASDASAYAVELLHSYRSALDASASFSIVAKSLGGLIAERALLLLSREVKVDLFLRIGVPDNRAVLPLTNVSRIVNVTSSGDRLYRAGLWITPVFLPTSKSAPQTGIAEIQFRRVTHSGLTECTALTDEGLGDVNTYDLYLRLIDSDAEVTQDGEKVGSLANRVGVLLADPSDSVASSRRSLQRSV